MLMSSWDLEYNGIYAALSMNDPQNLYHWALYLHHPNNGHTGFKFHAADGPNNTWSFEGHPYSMSDSASIVLLTKIGSIQDPTWGPEYLLPYIDATAIPMEVPYIDRVVEPKFTCRVWFREAIRQLDSCGLFLQCSDVNALESELIAQAMLAEALPSGRCAVSKYCKPVP